jgi:hypothetical protein
MVAQGPGIGDRDAGKPAHRNLQDGDVGFPVLADQHRLAAAPVRQRDQDFIGAVDYVLVGQDVTLGADHHSRTEVGFAATALAALQLVTEKLAEDGVVEQRMLLFLHRPGGVYGDHRSSRGGDRVGIGKNRGPGRGRRYHLLLRAVAG